MHDPRKHTTVTPPQRPPRPRLPRVVRRVDATVALSVWVRTDGCALRGLAAVTRRSAGGIAFPGRPPTTWMRAMRRRPAGCEPRQEAERLSHHRRVAARSLLPEERAGGAAAGADGEQRGGRGERGGGGAAGWLGSKAVVCHRLVPVLLHALLRLLCLLNPLVPLVHRCVLGEGLLVGLGLKDELVHLLEAQVAKRSVKLL